MKKYQDTNAETIDRWVDEGWMWGKPVSKETYQDALKGRWNVLLTPTRFVPKHWFPRLKGAHVLGLASGGGQQMPIFNARGATCTVFDYAHRQLESERAVADREGYKIEMVRGDMSARLPFDDETFDLVFHPVSNCYVKDAKHVFKEAYRVLKAGGVLLSGLGLDINYIVDEKEERIVQKLPFDPTTDEALYHRCVENDWGIQFSHSLEEQIGGQLQAGFILQELYEDTNGEGRLHDLNIPTYIATLSAKPEKPVKKAEK